MFDYNFKQIRFNFKYVLIVTNMFENFDKDFILLTKVYIEINEDLTHIVHKTFWSSCKYLFFKSNIFVMLFVF